MTPKSHTLTRVNVAGRRFVVLTFAKAPATTQAVQQRWFHAFRFNGPGIPIARHRAWLTGADREILICQDLGRRSLRDVLQSSAAGAARMSTDAARLLARLHAAGIAAPLDARHLIVRPRALNPLHRIGLAHAGDLRAAGRISERRRAADLAALAASLSVTSPAASPAPTPALCRRTLAAYRRESGLAAPAMRRVIDMMAPLHPRP